eukprot:12490281-Alexandrium_andersonii.AAC.1
MLKAVRQKARETANVPAYCDELHATPAAEYNLKWRNDEYAAGKRRGKPFSWGRLKDRFYGM